MLAKGFRVEETASFKHVRVPAQQWRMRVVVLWRRRRLVLLRVNELHRAALATSCTHRQTRIREVGTVRTCGGGGGGRMLEGNRVPACARCVGERWRVESGMGLPGTGATMAVVAAAAARLWPDFLGPTFNHIDTHTHTQTHGYRQMKQMYAKT